jgi:hypothetical protein
MSTFVRFKETFAVERAEAEWNRINANTVRLDSYDNILDLKGKLVFLLQPWDCKRLNIPWKTVDDYTHPPKAYYIFGRDKYVSRNNITGLSEWFKLHGGDLNADIIGFGNTGSNRRNNTSYQTAQTLILDMMRKHVNGSISKTNG